MWRDGELAARHERSYEHGHQVLNLEHYLDVLEKKPGAMRNSTPLQQWRAAGRWPACMDTIWQKLEQRHGRGKATREMIALVRAGTAGGAWRKLDRGSGRGTAAWESATPRPCSISCRCRMPRTANVTHLAVADELRQFERPMPVMDEYDALLSLSSARKLVIQ